MVYSGGERAKLAAGTEMGPTSGRSLKARLHNFNLPSFLKWGHQRQLRCKLPEKESGGGDDGRRGDRGMRAAPEAEEEEEGIDAVREKIMFDLKTAAEQMKVAMFRDGVSDEEDEDEDEEEEDDDVAEPERGKVAAATAAAAEEEVKRWNLRTRKGRNGNGNGAPAMVAGVSASPGGYSSSSPMKGVNNGRGEERKREKFSVTLSKKEIEEDFFAMVGRRPPRRPKKRPRTVQRQVDTIFPGLWLSEVKANTYKVPDAGKR